jgi:hypothetical protein
VSSLSLRLCFPIIASNHVCFPDDFLGTCSPSCLFLAFFHQLFRNWIFGLGHKFIRINLGLFSQSISCFFSFLTDRLLCCFTIILSTSACAAATASSFWYQSAPAPASTFSIASFAPASFPSDPDQW